jgi:heat shock protein HslJ
MPANSTDTSRADLLNTYWKLALINETEVAATDSVRAPHLIFNSENRVSGSDGCNRLMGTYLLEGNKLNLGEIAGTKMACEENTEQSAAFHAAMKNATTYTLHGDQMVLSDASGIVIARFKAVAQP